MAWNYTESNLDRSLLPSHFFLFNLDELENGPCWELGDMSASPPEVPPLSEIETTLELHYMEMPKR